ncbi:MAG: leucine-rich repeat domain-containing protein, partial [bacterium]|nr:leucine-rich repeat domain-containing protein [Candidatus Colousia faecequi]
MKKFLLFSFLLLIGACSSVTWGQHTETFGNATWTVDEDGIITSCTNIGVSGALTVPNTVDGKTVEGFADHLFRYNTAIKSLDFSQSNVSSLSTSLCEAATNLDSVNFGTRITTIGDYAFYGCGKLRSAVLPNDVESIGTVAFKNCTSIKLIKISSSIANSNLFSNAFSGAFANANDVTIIWGGGDISAGLFQNYAFLKKFVTESVSNNFEIYANAFQNCGNLETIQLTPNVISIGSVAFKGCTSLKNITIATTATSIDNSCFTNCDAIENIVWCANSNFPAGIFNSSAIKTVTFLNTDNISISASAFSGKTNLETVDFGQNITSIGNHAFDGCTGLSTISLPNSVASIGEYAFNGCTGLTGITLPSNLTSIEEYAFSGCTRLSAITLPNSVNVINKGVFDGCTALTSVNLANVTTIGEYAFRGCGMTMLTIPSTLTTLNPTAFANVPIKDLTWNTSLSPNFANNTTLTSVTFGNSGDLAIGNSAFSNCSALTTVNFGDHITSIEAFAFEYCAKLSSISLPEGLTSVGSVAFRYCGTDNTNGVTLTIPESLETLDAQAFYGTSIVNLTWKSTLATLNFSNNTTLSSVTFGNTASYDIPDNAFQNCTALTTVDFGQHIKAIGNNAFYGCENLNAIELPEGLQTIGNYAFYGCEDLNAIELPEGLQTIGNYAFKDCCKNHSAGISLTIPNSLTNYDATAFTNVPIANLTWNSNTSPAFPNNATLTTV